jgi:Peptidase M15
MFKSGNPNYGSVASAPAARVASAKATSQPRAERTSSARRSSRGVQVASLGGGGYSAPKQRSLGGGGGINWVASSSCLNGTLRGIVSHVASNFGAVTVSSTCRSSERNRNVGGAPKSFHLSGDAVDFRVHGNVSGAVAYLSGRSGGYKHMGGGLFHVDTGPTRRF